MTKWHDGFLEPLPFHYATTVCAETTPLMKYCTHYAKQNTNKTGNRLTFQH